ncbi:MAG: tyrosine protein phosphatase [Streptococcaceae bacterium]|jgi:protein-tyrosine phosphatase|nr:tyrosine protein phosphatase [Streptococcaceae bacterium]
MIDLHCHILPGIDDGAQTLEDSVEMAQVALEQGITHILCTPHHNNGKFINPKAEVITHVAKLQAILDERKLDLTLLEGQEIRITGDLLTEIANDRILFTDLNNQYLLLELPTQDVPHYTEKLFYNLRVAGKTPIIVHPERNAKFREDPNQLLAYLEMGCLAQLTAPSYIGKFGSSIQKTAYEMVKHNFVQMVASDAHGVKKRNFYLKEAFVQIEKDFGKEKVALLQQVAKDLVNGDAVSYPSFFPIRQHKFKLF